MRNRTVLGLVLMLFTYFIESNILITVIGVVLSILSYFLRF